MKTRSAGLRTLASAVGLAFFLVTGCTQTQECGTWSFTGTPSGNSFPMSVNFTFNPGNCGKSCDCTSDPIVQMVWVYDATNHMNLYASNQPQGTRSDANGWAIDQINGWAYAYYSLHNDGTFDGGYGLPGANGTASTLNDAPGGWGANTYFYAVDAPVCYASKGCKDKILGYYFWSYTLDNNDTGQKFIISPAWKDLDTEFQNAVAAWNAWAPTSGSENDGTGTLSHAVALPALSDL